MHQSTDKQGYVLKDGARENFVVKNLGVSLRCMCGCNVFSKLIHKVHGEVYECNACETWFKGE